MVKKRVYAYFDGSNFYHHIKSNYGITKINFLHLANNMINIDKEEIIKIKYFNSPVNREENPKAYAKQQKFFEVLKSTPKLELFLGNLVRRSLNNIHINCSNCGHKIADEIKCPGCNKMVNIKDCSKVSEKGVDVKMAINMLLDALEDEYDVALLFSCDADFSPAIDYIIKKLGKKVIYCRVPQPKTYKLIQTCSEARMITKEIVEKSQPSYKDK